MSPWKGARFESDDFKRKAAEAFNVTVGKGYYCDKDYDLKVHTQARIMPTGRLVIAELHPKKSSLPSFSFRWDEKADSLDVDIQGVTDTVENWFKKGTKGYAGHHPTKVGPGRTFEADIRIPQTHVFHGFLTFNLDRKVETTARLGLTANASVDTAQK